MQQNTHFLETGWVDTSATDTLPTELLVLTKVETIDGVPQVIVKNT